MEVRKVAYRFLKPGRVVRAEVPYADGTGRKMRPAVVVAVHGRTVELIAITSKRVRSAGDVVVADLEVAGLHKDSVARTGRLIIVDRVAVVAELGFLSDRDMSTVLVSHGEAA
jgi:hypothetical protein